VFEKTVLVKIVSEPTAIVKIVSEQAARENSA